MVALLQIIIKILYSEEDFLLFCFVVYEGRLRLNYL